MSFLLLFRDVGGDGPRHNLLQQSKHPTFVVVAFLLIPSLIIYFDLIIELPLNIRYVFLFIWLRLHSGIERLQEVLHLLIARILSLDTKCHFHLQILYEYRAASEQLRPPDGRENLTKAQEVVSKRIAHHIDNSLSNLGLIEFSNLLSIVEHKSQHGVFVIHSEIVALKKMV